MASSSWRFCRAVLVVICCWCSATIRCEWIQVPLKVHDQQQFTVEREIPAGIAHKLESLAVSLRLNRGKSENNTKQLDLELDKPIRTTTTTTKAPIIQPKRRKDVQATKKRIVEPFSIWNFLRSIRDSFFFKPTRSVQQKVGFLEKIRDNILTEIKRRILGIFLIEDQSQGERNRWKRHLEAEEHGHEFVSAEGALVTICFLTFSVFLIKLVLQIIYILKKKHYNMTTGTDGGTVGAVRRVIRNNQNARRIDPDRDEEDAQQLLSVMKSIT